MARRDLELETQFKDHMIQSVMPKKVAKDSLSLQNHSLSQVAEELLEKEPNRRASTSLDSTCRTSNATTTLNYDEPRKREST